MQFTAQKNIKINEKQNAEILNYHDPFQDNIQALNSLHHGYCDISPLGSNVATATFLHGEISYFKKCVMFSPVHLSFETPLFVVQLELCLEDAAQDLRDGTN